MLIITQISTIFGGKTILDNCTLCVKQNKPMGLLGVNGSGKTTLLMTVAGLILPNSGEIRCDEEKILNSDIAFVMKGLKIFYHSIFLKENFIYFCALKGISYAELEKRLYEDNLFAFIQNFHKEQFGKLSMGQKQLSAIILAMVFKSKILLLEESSNGLDIENKNRIISLIKEKAKNEYILISSHDTQFLYQCCESFFHNK